jgi:hypothetical protein
MDVVYATYSAQVATPDGGRWNVQGGQHWPADDPVVDAAPAGLFSPDARYGVSFSRVPETEAPMEQATAGPGEKRNVRRG